MSTESVTTAARSPNGWYTLAADLRTPVPDPGGLGRALTDDQIIVERTHVKRPRHLLVSTVFLKLDHSFAGGPPLLWKTMVFAANARGEVTSFLELDADRYSSRADADAGHAAMVSKCKRGKVSP